MSWNLTKRSRLVQPRYPVGLSNSPLCDGLIVAAPTFFSGGPSNPPISNSANQNALFRFTSASTSFWVNENNFSPSSGVVFGGGTKDQTTLYFLDSVASLISATNAVTVSAVIRNSAGGDPGDGIPIDFRNGSGSAQYYPFSDGNIYLGMFHTARWVNGVAPVLSAAQMAVPHLFTLSFRNGAQVVYQNTTVLTTGSVAANPAIGSANPYNGVGGHGGSPFGFIYALWLWNRALSAAEVEEMYANPWQTFAPRVRRIWFHPAAAVTSKIGGATDTLQTLQEKATGLTGVIAGTIDTLRPLTESATGRIGAIAGTKETLQPLQTKATGIIGVIAGAVETLRSLTESGGGTVTSNNVIGGSSDTLQPLTERATGIIGAIAGSRDTLRPLQTKATGIIGVVGSALDTLQPLQTQATGFSATQLAPPAPTAGGAPAWWGYEGFDGTRRPWWYKDLKDKIRELEILRQKRIEIGLLPPDEIIEEAEEFVEEIPTPATADYYIAKYEALSERIEKYVDQLEEDADEEFIMESAKFFFHHETRRNVWLSH